MTRRCLRHQGRAATFVAETVQSIRRHRRPAAVRDGGVKLEALSASAKSESFLVNFTPHIPRRRTDAARGGPELHIERTTAGASRQHLSRQGGPRRACSPPSWTWGWSARPFSTWADIRNAQSGRTGCTADRAHSAKGQQLLVGDEGSDRQPRVRGSPPRFPLAGRLLVFLPHDRNIGISAHGETMSPGNACASG